MLSLNNLGKAWIPLSFLLPDSVVISMSTDLSPGHPLRKRRVSPIARQKDHERYLLEEIDSSTLWVVEFKTQQGPDGLKYPECYPLETPEQVQAATSDL